VVSEENRERRANRGEREVESGKLRTESVKRGWIVANLAIQTWKVGWLLGCEVGEFRGWFDGWTDGRPLGLLDGWFVGDDVG
jgi:hypothetical protein